MKERYSISLDEDIIKSISFLSIKTGLSKSYITTKWILEGLKEDNRLSSSERYLFSKRIISDKINILFSSIGYNSNVSSNISNSMILLFLIPEEVFESNKEYILFQVSICELLDSIRKHDEKIFEQIENCLKVLKSVPRVTGSFEAPHIDSEDLKNSESSLLPARGTDITYNTNPLREKNANNQHGEP